MGFSRKEYWSGLPFPPPGDLPNPGIEPISPALEGELFITELPKKLEMITALSILGGLLFIYLFSPAKSLLYFFFSYLFIFLFFIFHLFLLVGG